MSLVSGLSMPGSYHATAGVSSFHEWHAEGHAAVAAGGGRGALDGACAVRGGDVSGDPDVDHLVDPEGRPGSGYREQPERGHVLDVGPRGIRFRLELRDGQRQVLHGQQNTVAGPVAPAVMNRWRSGEDPGVGEPAPPP